ncbi:MAG: preprotein translocase subunit SecE [Woeseiaceae bacterium]|jgi:preprotein translocase subunit SecE|nr:preprotein translocase subunit SecE [Woeseiaceae bacterium]
MTTQTETSQGSALDTVKLLLAAAAIVGGLYSYYYFEFDLPLYIRVLIVLVGTGAGIAIAMLSSQGQRLWHFIQGSRVEIRKVVWPTKQETTQTAIAVFVFTLVMSVFFWLLDSGLLWLTRKLVG